MKLNNKNTEYAEVSLSDFAGFGVRKREIELMVHRAFEREQSRKITKETNAQRITK